jgi:hypothetical protein
MDELYAGAFAQLAEWKRLREARRSVLHTRHYQRPAVADILRRYDGAVMRAPAPAGDDTGAELHQAIAAFVQTTMDAAIADVVLA